MFNVGSSYVVYFDQVFLLNLILDLVILWGAGKLAQARTTKWRLLAGAGIGAFYSLALFFPWYEFLFTVLIKFIFSVLMVFTAFPGITPKKFIIILGYFYLTSFTLGGIMFGMAYFLAPYGNPVDLIRGILVVASAHYPVVLIITLGTALILLKFGLPVFKEKFLKKIFQVALTIRFGQDKLSMEALVDTGNSLKDPITQMPVVIVEYEALKAILPAGIREVFQQGNEPDPMKLLSSLSDTSWGTRFRVIPFNSLGRHNGMLMGFKPDEIEVMNGDTPIRTREVIIAIYNKRLCPEGSYHALLHPGILQSSYSS